MGNCALSNDKKLGLMSTVRGDKTRLWFFKEKLRTRQTPGGGTVNGERCRSTALLWDVGNIRGWGEWGTPTPTQVRNSVANS